MELLHNYKLLMHLIMCDVVVLFKGIEGYRPFYCLSGGELSIMLERVLYTL